jgi:hypothetical protein
MEVICGPTSWAVACGSEADNAAAMINALAAEKRSDVVCIFKILKNITRAYGLLDDGSGKIIRKVVSDPSEAEPNKILPGDW